jgi:dUTP pyrophosphatase
MTREIGVLVLPHGRGLPLPRRETAGAAGLDLRAALAPDETLKIDPGRWIQVPTGLVFQLPAGYEAQIRPRSGLALRHGVTVLNAPGTIDADYRGEVQVLLVNHGQEPFVVTHGLRVAQLVVSHIEMIALREVDQVDSTLRGSDGFGSTGMSEIEAE